MFWFDKKNPHVLFCDNREFAGNLCDDRNFEVKPDMILDFTALPFDDESFWHIVFDPPHVMNAGENSWMAKKYGCIPKDWKPYIKAGFDECWRVLKTHGTLIFKWGERQITPGQIIKAIGRAPLYGQKERKNGNTTWLAFMKLPQEEDFSLPKKSATPAAFANGGHDGHPSL